MAGVPPGCLIFLGFLVAAVILVTVLSFTYEGHDAKRPTLLDAEWPAAKAGNLTVWEPGAKLEGGAFKVPDPPPPPKPPPDLSAALCLPLASLFRLHERAFPLDVMGPDGVPVPFLRLHGRGSACERTASEPNWLEVFLALDPGAPTLQVSIGPLLLGAPKCKQQPIQIRHTQGVLATLVAAVKGWHLMHQGDVVLLVDDCSPSLQTRVISLDETALKGRGKGRAIATAGRASGTAAASEDEDGTEVVRFQMEPGPDATVPLLGMLTVVFLSIKRPARRPPVGD